MVVFVFIITHFLLDKHLQWKTYFFEGSTESESASWGFFYLFDRDRHEYISFHFSRPVGIKHGPAYPRNSAIFL